MRLWDISFEDKMSLEEQILEFQVRSATSLYELTELKRFSFEEWIARVQRLKDVRAKQHSSQ